MQLNYTTNVSQEQTVTRLAKNALSINTSTQNNIVACGSENGVKSPLDNMGKKASPCETIIKRYSLQSQARVLLPNESVARCLRLRLSKDLPIEVHKAIMFKNAFYVNLQTCKSVWSCPICASKITERRRVELQLGIEKWQGKILLLTLTLQHSCNDTLKDTVTALLKGYSKDLTSGKFWDSLKGDFNIKGTIRTLEVTWGLNGFHPHLHVLLFLDCNEYDFNELHDRLYEKWEKSLHKLGRYTNKKAFNLQQSTKTIADYVTKWGSDYDIESQWTIAHEMTKNPVKVAKNGGLTPFSLLESSMLGNELHGLLFQEYFKYFKGKQQLRYSRDLKELLGLVDKTDEEICNEKIEQSYLFMVLSREQWKLILGNDIRAELLQQVANGDIEDVVTYLSQFGIEWDIEQFGYTPCDNEN